MNVYKCKEKRISEIVQCTLLQGGDKIIFSKWTFLTSMQSFEPKKLYTIQKSWLVDSLGP